MSEAMLHMIVTASDVWSDCGNSIVDEETRRMTAPLVTFEPEIGVKLYERGEKAVVDDRMRAELDDCGVQYEVESSASVDDVRTCVSRGAHGVPLEVVAKMAVEMEEDPRGERVFLDGETESEEAEEEG